MRPAQVSETNRRLGFAADETLTFGAGDEAGALRDENTASTWEIRSGVAVDGPLSGTRLQRLSAPLVYWFAWSTIYPNTDISTTE